MSASYPILVRDGIIDRVKNLSFFSGFKFSSNRALSIQPGLLPFCGVYFIEEKGIPEGDANAGEPRFRTTARYGFSVVVLNSDADLAERQLDNAMQALTNGLLSDSTLYNNATFRIQSYLSTSRQHVFGATGQDNEHPVAELRFELVCDLGTITYPPIVEDDLNVIHVTTAFPAGGTPEEQAAVQQVEAQYDLFQNP